MSYQVLARKHRPKNFSEVVGQEHVLNSLIHGLDQNRLHHAYLFTGTRGVGKTSLARLLAKSVNCLKGVSSKPCGNCDHCIAIEQGRFVDLIEIDAASRTKVEDTRDILDNVQYMPSQGKYKIYLIDEVHMLSQHSFNALLKTLEEPPEHVKFLLATTDPHKLPITILSRCLQFNLKHITELQIKRKLEDILSYEQIPFETDALSVIAHAADGSMRDALSLTDQSIAFSKGQIVTADVKAMLGIVDTQMLDTLLLLILEENTTALIEYSNDIIQAGKSPESVLNAISECFYYASLTNFKMLNLENLPCTTEVLTAITQNYSLDQLQLYYQLSIKAKEDIHLAPTAQCGLGMALLRLCAFSLDLNTPFQENTAYSRSQVQKKNEELDELKAPLAHSKKESYSPITSIPQETSHIDNLTQTQEKTLNYPTDTPSPLQEIKEINLVDILSQHSSPQVTAYEKHLEKIDWYQISQSLGLKGTVLQVVLNCSLFSTDNNIYTLQAADSIKALITPNSIQKIEDALSKRQGHKIILEFTHLNIKNKTTRPISTSQQKIKELETNNFSVQQNQENIADLAKVTSFETSSHNTPAQINQQQKEKRIDQIYQSLKQNADIQKLESIGFEVLKENIKLTTLP